MVTLFILVRFMINDNLILGHRQFTFSPAFFAPAVFFPFAGDMADQGIFRAILSSTALGYSMNYQRRASYCDLSSSGQCVGPSQGKCPDGYVTNSSDSNSCAKLPLCNTGLIWDPIGNSWTCPSDSSSSTDVITQNSCPKYATKYLFEI